MMFIKTNVRAAAEHLSYRVYQPKDKDVILLGYEYENQVSDEQPIPKHFNQSWDPFNISINAYGWEIRSPVAPLEFHKRVWRRFFNNGKFQFNREPSYEGARNYYENEYKALGHGAGIHVSVSHSDFTIKRLPKAVQLLTYNHDKWLKLSGRSKSQYHKYAEGRNLCLNVNRHECRVFTAHPDLLIPALEFTESVVLANTDNYEEWRDFVEQSSRYPQLRDRLQQLEI